MKVIHEAQKKDDYKYLMKYKEGEFTEGQKQYFKDSIIKHPCYRVTRGGSERTSFNTNHLQCFSPDPDYAKEYADKDEDPTRYDVYLNIKNPLSLKDGKEVAFYNNWILPWMKNEDTEKYASDGNYKFEKKKLGDVIDPADGDRVFNFLKYRNFGYDGLIIDEMITKKNKRLGRFAGIKTYVPLEANQIKYVTNINPTSSPELDK